MALVREALRLTGRLRPWYLNNLRCLMVGGGWVGVSLAKLFHYGCSWNRDRRWQRGEVKYRGMGGRSGLSTVAPGTRVAWEANSKVND
jgi:hypothetical protein